MFRRFLYSCMLLAAVYSSKCFAQDEVRILPVKARYLTTDESGNAYVVRNDNVLIRYNEHGDSTGFYNSVLNGAIGNVDALNPLRIFVFYPDYSRIVWLDRTLNPQGDADLRRLNVPSGAIAAPSSDNAIWVYDSYSATLRKIDEQGNVRRSSNDLRQQLGFVPEGLQLMERERKVFLIDSSRGVLVFDQFGSYLSELPLKGITQFRYVADKSFYLRDSSIYAGSNNFMESDIAVAGGGSRGISAIKSFSETRQYLILLYENRIEWRPLHPATPPK